MTATAAPLWQTAFPDFPHADMPAIPAGWKDASWRNDACPFFLASPSIGVWVDCSDPAKRELGESARFAVVPMADGMHPLTPYSEWLITDDWQAVLDFVAAYVPPSPAEAPAPAPHGGEAAPDAPAHADPMRAFLAAEYVKRIGYDPFADSPSISPVEVARTLLEHGDENTRAALDAVAENVAEVIATARRNAFPVRS